MNDTQLPGEHDLTPIEAGPRFAALPDARRAAALAAIAEPLPPHGDDDDLIGGVTFRLGAALQEDRLPPETLAKIRALEASGQYETPPSRGPWLRGRVGDPGGVPVRKSALVLNWHRRSRLVDFAYEMGNPQASAVAAVVLLLFIGLLGKAAASAVISSSIATSIAGIVAALAVLVSVIVGDRVERQAPKDVRFTAADWRAVRAATFRFNQDVSETRSAAWADYLASSIEAMPVWSSPYLDRARLTYSPADDAVQVSRHAAQILLMRRKLGVDERDLAGRDSRASALVGEQLQILDGLTASLRNRVAAMWDYRASLEELQARIKDLQRLEAAIGLAPEVDQLARQLGADEYATDRLSELTAEAQVLTEQITTMVEHLDLARTVEPEHAVEQ
ncbi:hypothetical protein SAMN04489765_0174 [Tsukamurella pulmonis]|uniref:Uncharacterized protein n=2 Tax=Tsukamurella pulmonis TaxID=47312 RepID=A0A1H1ADR1_9ACTN|nr:hypothetical protein SAMN04489765_0174 [Tsukamurella pulmonis]SUQ39362.1 Uncharacterised protein [Tsukamurella pulmonis]